MDLVNYLRSGKTLEQLKNTYPISCKHDSEYPELVCFHYTYVPPDLKLDPILKQARGIILNSADNWNIVSYPYDKFYNFGEPGADVIDISTMKVVEKLDGSLMTLYNFDNKWKSSKSTSEPKGEWRVSTSSVPDASGRCNTGLIFKNLFERAWQHEGYLDKSVLNPNYCYMFELCTNDNRVVLEHPYDQLILHGMRDLRTLKELDPHTNTYGFKTPRTFNGSNLEELAKYVDTVTDIEGFIVVDASFNRNKMKTKTYLQLHHTATSRGVNLYEMVLKAVQTRNTDEWLAKFPMHREVCNKIEGQFEQILNDVCDTYGRLEGKNKKNFALAVKDNPYKKFLFSINNSNRDPEEFMRDVSVVDLIPYIKI